MKKNIFLLGLALLFLASSAFAFTAVQNGSFEFGNTTFWAATLSHPANSSFDVNGETNLNLFPAEGDYWGMLEYYRFTAGTRQLICTDQNVMAADTNTEICFSWGTQENALETRNAELYGCINDVTRGGVDVNCAVSEAGANSAGRVQLVDETPANNPMADTCLFLYNQSSVSAQFCFAVPDAGGGVVGNPEFYGFDNVRYRIPPYLTNTITEPAEPVSINTAFTIEITVADSNSTNPVTDANVELNFNSEGNTQLTYDAVEQAYIYSDTGRIVGDYTYVVSTQKGGFSKAAVDSGTIEVRPAVSDYIVITNISNISNNVTRTAVELTPADTGEDFVFKLENTGTITLNVDFNIFNGNDSGKQYKIYSATESDYAAGTWGFEDTLTWGSTNYDSIQKIWNSTTGKYNYSFNEIIGSLQVKYYRLEFYTPAYYFHSIDNDLWINALAPNNTDFNGTEMDLFGVSAYSNISSVLSEPIFPTITSDTSDTSFVFQLTAKTPAQGAGHLNLGTQSALVGGAFSSTQVDVNTNFRTLTITNLENGYAKLTSSAPAYQDFYVHNYTISERGFFTRPLEAFKSDGSELPVILEGGLVLQYISEGKDFIVNTAYLNPDNNIDRIEVSAYVGGVAVGNQIKKWVFDAETDDDQIVFREKIGGLIDLTADAPNRIIVLTVRLIDNKNNYFEIQSKALKLVQFPFFPGDYSINAFIKNKKVASNPTGTILIRNIAPETLEAVNFYISRTAFTPASSDYNKTFVKGIDFDCRGFDCSFNYDIDDWVFTTSGTHYLTVSSLLTTEAEDTNSLKTARTIVFGVVFRAFETARILETVERTAHDYRNDEEINLVMQLRDEDLANLKQDLQIYIEPFECDAATAGNCFTFDVNYLPDSFLYDATTGYNYYFFREIFVKSNGGLPEDTNHIRFVGTVLDKKNKHTGATNPILAPKCNIYPAGDCNSILCFIPNALAGLNHFLNGCTTPTSAIVTLDSNTEEQRILVNAGKSVTAPTQECFACLNTDSNNNYTDNLKQDLFCASWYTFNEATIDGFDFRITNNNSDLSKDKENRQFIELKVPYELIQFNDLQLMRKSLETEFSTEIDTIGELIYNGFNSIFTGIANPLIDIPENYTKIGIIPNAGLDCNFSRALDSTYIDGLVFFKVNGLKVTNKQDLVQNNSDLENVAAKDLIEFLNYEGKRFSMPETTIEVYVSDMTKVMEQEVNSPLIIDVPFSEATVRRENAPESQQYESLPTQLKFNVINDLVYFAERYSIRRYVPITLTQVIDQQQVNILLGALGAVALLTSNPGKFMVINWFPILVAMILLLFTAVVVRNFRARG